MKTRRRRGSSRALFLPFLLLTGLVAGATSACSGGGSGGGAATGSADLLVTSSGSPEVFALSGEVEEARLISAGGERSANLLAAPTRVEFVGAEQASEWIARGDVPAGTYEALELRFAPGSIEATDMAGDVTRPTIDDRARVYPLDRPLELGARATDGLVMRLEIAASLTTGPGGLPEFEPDFDVFPDEPVFLEGLVGRLQRFDAPSRTLLVERAVDTGEGSMSFEALLGDETVLIDVDGTVFPAESSFFASLLPGATILEIDGRRNPGGLVHASRVRIRDYVGTGNPLVRIEGMILHVELSQGFFVLLIRDIEEGERTAERALAAIGDPSSIDVHFDARTEIVLESGERVRPDALRVGQEVEAVFSVFVSPPFRADRVELEDRDICLSAEIVDVSGLPESIVVRVDGSCPLVSSGQIRSPRTNVTVELEDAEIRLQLRGEPRLRPSQLSPGMKVHLCGALEGDPEEPELEASSVRVHAGHLIKGEPVRPNAPRSRFVVAEGQIVQPFGSEVTGTPVDVVIDPQARFLQDASSERGFFAALEEQGREADVKIKGLQSGNPEEIRAYEIKLKLRKRK